MVTLVGDQGEGEPISGAAPAAACARAHAEEGEEGGAKEGKADGSTLADTEASAALTDCNGRFSVHTAQGH